MKHRKEYNHKPHLKGISAKYLTSLVAQTVKRLSTMQETQVRSRGWEDPLEKEMAIHSSTIAWKIPWTEEPGSLQSMGSQRDTTERLHFQTKRRRELRKPSPAS